MFVGGLYIHDPYHSVAFLETVNSYEVWLGIE